MIVTIWNKQNLIFRVMKWTAATTQIKHSPSDRKACWLKFTSRAGMLGSNNRHRHVPFIMYVWVGGI